MRKITLLAAFTLLVFQFGNAQQTISFEASEGYTIGDINTQNGWTTTGDGSGGFVVNQDITSEAATDGTNSLKIANDDRFGYQSNGPIIGGFYNYSTPVDYTTLVVSADIQINDIIDDASDYRLGTVSTTAGFFTSIVNFSFDGTIAVLANGAFETTTATWTPGTWYNVRVEMTDTDLTYFIDDVQINQAPLSTDQQHDTEQVRFIHDNYSLTGYAYMDNFRTNDEPLSVDTFESLSFKHFYNKNTNNLTLKSSSLEFNHVRIFNTLGQEVLKRSLSQTDETINMSSVQDGVYLAKVTIDGREKTIKFIKN